jgi:cardiolipin synthase
MIFLGMLEAYIANAYCAPSSSQTRSLVAAVKRGVDVRLLLPGKHNDQPATKAARRTAYGELLQRRCANLHVRAHRASRQDDRGRWNISVLGSSNFDARSAQINEELDTTVYDKAFGRDAGGIRARFAALEAYTLEDFEKRSLWERFVEWVMLPFHSQI